MEFKYHWKEITDDGLLKEPKDCGPHYSQDSFNGGGGFYTKEDAIRRLERLKREYEWDIPSELVLIKIY